MELEYLEDDHLVCLFFYFSMHNLIIDKMHNFFLFNSWTFWLQKNILNKIKLFELRTFTIFWFTERKICIDTKLELIFIYLSLIFYSFMEIIS